MAVDDSSAPRIPKIYDYFTSEERMAYLVMEYIDTDPVAESDPGQVAGALQWLYDLPVPQDIAIGSLGDGHARHRLFKNFRAPMAFSSMDALQRYMNRALKWIPPKCRPQEINFSGERLVFTQSDMDESNFFLDKNGKICMVDFEDVGLLPQSFASFTVNSGCNPFAKDVAQHLHWSHSPNLYSMARAGGILNMMSDSTLALNKDGWPRACH